MKNSLESIKKTNRRRKKSLTRPGPMYAQMSARGKAKLHQMDTKMVNDSHRPELANVEGNRAVFFRLHYLPGALSRGSLKLELILYVKVTLIAD